MYRTKRNNLLFYLTINNINEFSKLINKDNVNDIIDEKLNYTILHHAIRFDNLPIIELLLSLNANPYLKTSKNEDAIDLSIKYNSHFTIRQILNEYKHNNTILACKNKSLEAEIKKIKDKNNYLIDTIQDIQQENKTLKNNKLKYDDLEYDFQELTEKYKNLENLHLKNINKISSLNEDNLQLIDKNTTLKRKLDDLNESYIGLAKQIKK
jgi:predicted RNase H-like nuclease (RuvC/YqgF family)